jgi:hypothetical protein
MLELRTVRVSFALIRWIYDSKYDLGEGHVLGDEPGVTKHYVLMNSKADDELRNAFALLFVSFIKIL